MNYTFFAIGCYIAMRSIQVLCEGRERAKWTKLLILLAAIFTLYAAVASLIVWYQEMPLLGFRPN